MDSSIYHQIPALKMHMFNHTSFDTICSLDGNEKKSDSLVARVFRDSNRRVGAKRV